MEIDSTVRSLVTRTACSATLGDDDDLISAGLLDSVGVLSLVAGLEKSFGIKLSTAHLNEKNFRSIRAIADLIHSLMTEGKQA